MNDVFISYARSSAGAQASALREALTARGIAAFFDTQEIPPGGRFPDYLAEALLDARVIVVFADAAYFARPWCVYEFRIALAPWFAAQRAGADATQRAETDARRRAGTDATQRAGLDAAQPLRHVVIALAGGAAAASAAAHLPPALASLSWPTPADTAQLVDLVAQRLATAPPRLRENAHIANDEAIRALRDGAAVPAPVTTQAAAVQLERMPLSLKERFVGRHDALWQLFHLLQTRAAGAALHACAIQGGAGAGKSQLAAEFVARYGAAHFPGGLVWIDCDCSDEELAAQFDLVRAAFTGTAPSAQAPELKHAARALAQAVRARVDPRPVLWVADNVPEPVPGQPPRDLSAWCPPLGDVVLLCTSRVAGLKGVHFTLALAELALDDALRMLTQPPVEAAWLAEDEWRDIVRWVGALPLALRLLNVAVGDGYASARDVLAQARAHEAAPALDAMATVIADEVPAGHARGVAQALAASFARLAPEARTAALCLAWLAPARVAESALARLVPQPQLGVLGRRSWLNASSTAAGERQWAMHRLTASWLRASDGAHEEDATAVVNWIAELATTGDARALDWPLRLVVRRLAHRPEARDWTRVAATLSALAEWAVDEEARLGTGYLAALGCYVIGAGDALAERLAARLPTAEWSASHRIAHVASALRGSTAAAQLMLALLADPRPDVRRSGTIFATSIDRPDLLAEPVLDTLTEDDSADFDAYRDSHFEPFLRDARVLRDMLSVLFDRVRRVPVERRPFLVRVLGRALALHGAGLEAGGWRAPHVAGGVLAVALESNDRAVTEAAAWALACWEWPGTFEALRGEVQRAESDARWHTAVALLAAYAWQLERPGPVAAEMVEDDEGRPSLRVQLPPSGKRRRELFVPLVDAYLVAAQIEPATADSTARRELLLRTLAYAGRPLSAPQRLSEDLVAVTGYSESVSTGLGALMDRFYALLDAGDLSMNHQVTNLPSPSGRGAGGEGEPPGATSKTHTQARGARRLSPAWKVAEDAVRVLPDLSSSWWWRGQLRARAGDAAGAMADYRRVVELSPEFADAWVQLGYLHECAGDVASALADYSRAIELDGKEAYPYSRRASLRDRQGDFAGAAADYEQALALDPNDASTWFGRALLRERTNDPDGARADYETALNLAPDDAETRFRLASTLFSAHRFEDALTQLREALARDPKSARLHLLTGICWFNLQRFEEAIGALDEALHLEPNQAEALFVRGYARLQRGDQAGAITDLEAAVESEPSDERAGRLLESLRSDQGP